MLCNRKIQSPNKTIMYVIRRGRHSNVTKVIKYLSRRDKYLSRRDEYLSRSNRKGALGSARDVAHIAHRRTWDSDAHINAKEGLYLFIRAGSELFEQLSSSTHPSGSSSSSSSGGLGHIKRRPQPQPTRSP